MAISYKNQIPPFFNATEIISTDCDKSGKFIISGKIMSKIEKEIIFSLRLTSLTKETKCTLPKAEENEDIKVECLLEEKITDEKIMIEQCTILRKIKEEILRWLLILV